MPRLLMWTAAVALVTTAGGYAIAAQAPQPPPAGQAGDAVAALVTEVRALRTDLSAMASASVRSQLLVARVQLQEQRLVHLDRQRGEISAKLRDAQAMRTMIEGQIKPLADTSRLTPDQRRETDGQVNVFKTQIEAMEANENALRAEESTLLNSIATEQARWTDFNGRIDQLEQSLPRR